MDTRCWAYAHSILGRFDWGNITVWDPDNSGNLDTVRINMLGMTPGDPLYDTSYGNAVPPEEQSTKYKHGTPVKTAVAVIQAGRVIRGSRVLDNKFGVFTAEESKAFEYAFPSTFDEYSDRRYHLVFLLNVTRVWNSKKANASITSLGKTTFPLLVF